MSRPVDSTTLAYADLAKHMPWLKEHIAALKTSRTITVTALDLVLLDIATANSAAWAIDMDMNHVIDRLDLIQTEIRLGIEGAGIPYTRQD